MSASTRHFRVPDIGMNRAKEEARDLLIKTAKARALISYFILSTNILEHTPRAA